mmetsp:Transcript_62525/g.116238  ORF Transcript_62525/g.116238 Transcript_62525/m.116238 type:complete len:200 (-) Transcript_62525:186-785(-)
MFNLPPDAEVSAKIRELLRGEDLSQLSLKTVRTRLAAELDIEPEQLDGHKDKLKTLTAEIVTDMQSQKEASEVSQGQPSEPPDASAADEPDESDPTAASSSASAPTKKKRNRESEGTVGPGAAKQKQCNLMTKSMFAKKAEPLELIIAGKKLKAAPKTFSTGSAGWFVSGKVPVEVGGETVQVQCTLNLPVIGSKEWKA